MIYESIIEGKNIEKGLELTNSEKISTYEQVLETFLIHTNKTDDELKIIAYLRKVFGLVILNIGRFLEA